MKMKPRIAFLSVLPLLVILALTGIFSAIDTTFVFEPPFLLPLLNTLFLAAVPITVAVLAARSYMVQGTPTFLLLGCGLLSFGLGSLLSGWGLVPGGQNFNVTLHNLGSLLGGFFHFSAAILTVGGWAWGIAPFRVRPRLSATISYLAIVLLFTLISLATFRGAIPVFFAQGAGPTFIRQIVLSLAALLFAVSAVHFAVIYMRSKVRFFYFYASALAFISTGLFCLLFQKNVGGLGSWMARLSQYVGSIYFLVGLVRSLQETIARGTTLPKYLKDIFRSYVEEQVRIGTQELKTLNARLLDEIAERMRIEEELRSINEFVLKTSRMHGVDNLCQAAAQVAQATNPESYVVVTFHDPDLGGLRVRAVEGLGDRIGELANILNAEPSSIWGSVSSMGDQAKAVASLFTSNRLEEIPGGFVTLCDGMIPADTCRAISEAFAVEKVYVAGLSLGDQLMGGLALILHKGAALFQRTAIETIASHLAVLLDRSLGELTLRESEARFRALWEHSIVGSLLTAPDGSVFAANPAACRLFGRTEEDIRGIGRAGLVDFADRRVFALLSERAEKGYASGQMTFLRADGTRFLALCSSAIFETAYGSRTCMVIQDISEMKQAEKRVRVFSRQLLSVQEEEKRRLSAVLHHDVGSISVGLSARLLAAEEDLREGKSEQALASIRECRRMFAKAVKRLKALAVDLRPPDLDLLGLTAALRQHFLELSRVSPLRIHFTDAAGGAEIGPEAQTILFRAAQECLNNVIEHAEAQWVRVRLSVTRRLIRLVITDGGKGFNSDRLAGKTDRHLGLHAMQEMAASLGGEVVVESAKGQGTTIRVNLPREGRSA